MLNIYICEDNLAEQKLFRKYVEDTILIEELDMQVELVSTDPKEILKRVRETENTGVFFLDIDLQTDMTGLTLAQELRKIQPRCFVIFITTHMEMGYTTFQFKVEALDFIVKDAPECIQKRIHECLLDVNEKSLAVNDRQKSMMVINQGERKIAVDYDEIMYVETSEDIHKLVLHTRNRILEFKGQLKEIELQLDDRFYQTYRSQIINIDYAKEIDFQQGTITMANGDTCMVSSRKKPGLKKLLMQR